MISHKRVSLLFLLVQSVFMSMSCICFAFLAPVMQRFGYDTLHIGTTMTLAAFAAMMAQPFWGYLNDKTSASKQVVLGATGVACVLYALLLQSGGTTWVVNLCVMGMYATMNCMMGFIDAWTAKLIAEGYAINYGATRSGGSFSYAVTAMVFGLVIERMGFAVAPWVVGVLLSLLVVVVCLLPNPVRLPKTQQISVVEATKYLLGHKLYLVFLGAYFLKAFTTCGTESFFSVLVTELGGSESYVGIGLFVMAMSELPLMIFYRRIKAYLGWSASAFVGLSTFFFGLKALCMGFAPNFGILLVSVVLHGLSFAMFMPAYVDFMLEHIDKKYLSTAQLFAGAFGASLGAIVANTFDGWLAKVFGIQIMLRFVCLFAFVAAGMMLVPLFLKLRRKDDMKPAS